MWVSCDANTNKEWFSQGSHCGFTPSWHSSSQWYSTLGSEYCGCDILVRKLCASSQTCGSPSTLTKQILVKRDREGFHWAVINGSYVVTVQHGPHIDTPLEYRRHSTQIFFNLARRSEEEGKRLYALICCTIHSRHRPLVTARCGMYAGLHHGTKLSFQWTRNHVSQEE